MESPHSRTSPQPRSSNSSAKALEDAMKGISDLDQIPTCFLVQLLGHELFCPDVSGERIPDKVPLSGRMRQDGTSVSGALPKQDSIDAFTSKERCDKAFHAPRPNCRVYYLEELVAAARIHEAHEIRINPNQAPAFSLPASEFPRLEKLASDVGHCTDKNECEEVGISSGSEIEMSSPEPEVSEEFLALLKAECGPRTDIKAVYVFDLAVDGDQPGLTVGIIPTDDTARPALDEFLMNILNQAPPLLQDRNQLDAFLLDEEMIEAVSSTVPPIDLGRSDK
ncbi:MAG: hypothetical protein WA705_08365 [Candidatus Ozemobacteraceae bacterium]